MVSDQTRNCVNPAAPTPSSLPANREDVGIEETITSTTRLVFSSITPFMMAAPHISTVDQAYNAVAACRYPRMKDAPRYEPSGVRGDAPVAAARYWGLMQQEYYKKADVWPLNPQGEILVILMIEDTQGIANLNDILKNVPGVGMILIGEGDLSQELGCAREYDNPCVLDALKQVVATCKEHKVPVGHPHVDSNNVERIIDEGYTFLVAAPVRTYAALDKGRQLTGRK